jgi:hypothetical protein
LEIVRYSAFGVSLFLTLIITLSSLRRRDHIMSSINIKITEKGNAKN